MLVEAELELRVGDDDAARRRVIGRFLVQPDRDVANRRGELGADAPLGFLERDVLVVMAHLGLRGGREDRLGELLRVRQAGRQLDAAHLARRLVVLPAAARQIAAHDRLDEDRLKPLDDDRAPLHLLDLVGGDDRLGRDARQMVRDDVREPVEPEVRHLVQHAALVRNRLAHDDVERRQAIGRDDQELVVAERVVVADLAATEERQRAQRGFVKGRHRLFADKEPNKKGNAVPRGWRERRPCNTSANRPGGLARRGRPASGPDRTCPAAPLAGRPDRTTDSTHHLREVARLVLLGDLLERHRLDLRRLALAAERQIARDADLLRRFARGLQVIARIELARILEHVAADRARDRETQVGVDVDLAHAVLDAFLDFLDGHAVGFLHVAAELADFREQILRHRRRPVHHEVGVRNARVNLLDPLDRQDVARRLLRELVRTVRRADRDRERVALRELDEVGGLLGVRQQLLARHRAFGAVAVFLVALHRLERAEHAELGLDRHADRVRHLDDLAGHVDIVFVRCDRLAVGLERAVHHHAREAAADRRHAHGGRLAVILVHHDGNVRVRFHRRLDQVAQERLARVLPGARRCLHDHGRADFVGGRHDRLHLFQVVHVERGQAVAVLRGVIQQLTH
ncbi:hypothetical protein BURPS1710b_0998 [Burkholderia pseudomallei 1710b]|uniref:Uncharacterized protein n=1 Tax=Burkholderia pseudomallei (strain 1710b) TaxID=320372 RepID=Q3JVJ3_BURP1|nr:hypothetical protein BURPS1710b_0998 [Burkholderia pseudomallei 1710b]